MSFSITDILLLLIPFVIFPKLKLIKPLSSVNSEYLSLKTSQSLRGLCALLIMFHHMSQQIGGGLFSQFVKIGYLVVSVFFFLSGYGLMKSMENKSDYQKGFLVKRLSAICVPYFFVSIFYWIWNDVRYQGYSFSDLWQGLKHGTPLVFNSWYIIAIIVFYVFFYLFMVLFKKNKTYVLIASMLWTIGYVIFCRYAKFGVWWYNSIHLLWFGMFYETCEQSFIKLFQKIQSIFIPLLFVTTLGCFTVNNKFDLISYNILLAFIVELSIAVLFVLCVLVFSMKFRFGNIVADYLGKISLELYLIHGLYVSLFHSSRIYIKNDLLWCLAVIGASVVSASLLYLLDRKAISLIMLLNKKAAHTKKDKITADSTGE